MFLSAGAGGRAAAVDMFLSAADRVVCVNEQSIPDTTMTVIVVSGVDCSGTDAGDTLELCRDRCLRQFVCGERR